MYEWHGRMGTGQLLRVSEGRLSDGRGEAFSWRVSALPCGGAQEQPRASQPSPRDLGLSRAATQDSESCSCSAGPWESQDQKVQPQVTVAWEGPKLGGHP